MLWSDDDDEKVAVPTAKCFQHKPPWKTHVGQTILNEACLEFKTATEDAKHSRSCTSRKCQWCMAMNFIAKNNMLFQTVPDGLMANYKDLDEKHKLLAKASWLGKGPRGSEVVLGCIPCRVMGLQGAPGVASNPLANYQFPSVRVGEKGGRPHVLQRHAHSVLHLKAVTKFLGKDGEG